MPAICASAPLDVSTPSATMSTAIASAAQSVRLARRVCNRNSSPDWTVNSKSWASPNSVSSARQISFSLVHTAGRVRRSRLVVRQVSPSGDDVLTLSVELEVEIEFARACGGVAGEAHPCARRAAGIAEDHCLHRDSRAGCVVDPVQASITDRLLRVPGPQYGLGRGEKLHAGVGGKGLPRQVTVARQHRTG